MEIKHKMSATVPFLLAFSAVTLGLALQKANGALHETSIFYLSIALGLLWTAGLLSHPGVEWQRPSKWAYGAMSGLVLLQLLAFVSKPPGIYISARNAFASYVPQLMLLGFFIGLAVAAGRARPRLATCFAVGVSGLLATWIVRASPTPHIDVFTWTNYALDLLHGGNNPYLEWMPNLYGHTRFFPEGSADPTWVHAGYTYPPASLYLSWLGRMAFGDVRYASIACLMLAALLMGFGAKRLSVPAALLLLTTPRLLFVVEQAWTDAFLVGEMALFLWLHRRKSPWAPYALGLLCATKQHMVFAIPLLWLILPRPLSWRTSAAYLAKAVAVIFATMAPFLIWDAPAFLKTMNITLVFRPDALSFVAWTAHGGARTMPPLVQWVMTLLAYGLVLLRTPKTSAGFATGIAIVYCTLFAFAHHAFCNQYFFVLSAALMGLAFRESSLERDWTSPQPTSPSGGESPRTTHPVEFRTFPRLLTCHERMR